MTPTLRQFGVSAPLDHPLACAEGATTVRVLDYYDGPLCALRRNTVGEHVVFVWVDQDAECNRWLAFAVPDDVAALLTHGDVGPTAEQLASITNGALVDIDCTHRAWHVVAVWPLRLVNLPDDLLSIDMRAMDVPHRLAVWLEGPYHDPALAR
mgnify:CR=1 FL=1